MSLNQLSRSSFFYFHSSEYSLLASFINHMNLILTFAMLIICTISNFLSLITYKRKRNKLIESYFMPLYICANQISIILFFAISLSFSSKYQSLLNFSAYSCKIFTFVFHTSSTLLNWIHVAVPILEKLYVKNSIVAMKRIKHFFFILIVIFCAIYSTDLNFLELIEANPNYQNKSFKCGINIRHNPKTFLITDILDFTIYCVIPIFIIVMIILKTESSESIKKLIIALFIFLTFWLPIFVVIFYRDYQIIAGKISVNYYSTSGFKIEIFFTVFLIMNRFFPAIAVLMDAGFNESTRSELSKLICKWPFKVKNPNEQNKHVLEPKTHQSNISIDQIRREFYSNYYSVRHSEIFNRAPTVL